MNHLAALAHFPKLTYNRYQKLAAYFSDFKDVWDAEISDLVPAGLEENIAHEFLTWREKNPLEKIFTTLEKEQIETVSIHEANYPTLLKEIADPPHTLFIRGKLPPTASPTLAVVGTRKFTAYGKLACEDIVGPLASQGFTIISGLALGIDGIAHHITLANNGTTVAVLGTGINKRNVYPAFHQPLSEKIIANGGAIVSEYPPGFAPTKYSFPARNRIIAGMSMGTLVIEAAETSGALITARCALDYNREVFAVPHPIHSVTGAGPNNLIKMGAKIITSHIDITEAFNIEGLINTVQNKVMLPSSPTEAKIIAALSKEPQHIDIIIKTTDLDSPTVNSCLILMEMKGMIRNLGGMNYVLK